MTVDISGYFGYIKLVETHRIEGNDVVLGGYAINYDRNGNELSRTENTDNLRVVNGIPYAGILTGR